MGSTSAPGGGIAPEAQRQSQRQLQRAMGRRCRIAACIHAADAMREHVRDGRCAELLHLRSDHGAQRKLLPLHELRLDFRMQLGLQSEVRWGNWIDDGAGYGLLHFSFVTLFAAGIGGLLQKVVVRADCALRSR